jgi:hypothetical protein
MVPSRTTEQLGIEPDQKLQRFHLRILADDPQLSIQDWLPWADGIKASESKIPSGLRRPLDDYRPMPRGS